MADPLDIYMIAIGGTGMAPLACLLKEQGHTVRGSDGPLYPPMSTLLERAGIEPIVGFDAKNLEPRPDLVIVGNAVPRTHPEAEAVEGSDIPRISMPEALARFFLDSRKPLVVAGTHGKTTTTSMASWIYSACGREPSYLIGGVPLNLEQSFRNGDGERFVLEGDEYNAAYFDRGPKFLHYRPHAAILTSAEYDHADLYPDPESLLAAYSQFVDLIPADGVLAAYGDSPEVVEIVRDAACRVILYGFGDHNDLTPEGEIITDLDGSRFTLPGPDGSTEIRLKLGGDHNVLNAMAVWAVARFDGISGEAIAEAFADFTGVKRRMEELGTRDGVTVIDDFAHHPTAIGATVAALRATHRDRRLVVVFEPRSLTAARAFLFDAYWQALGGADRVFLAPIFHAARLTDEERLDLDALAAELRATGVRAQVGSSVDELEQQVLAAVRRGDVVVTMSSGSFEGLPHRLLAGLGSER